MTLSIMTFDTMPLCTTLKNAILSAMILNAYARFMMNVANKSTMPTVIVL